MRSPRVGCETESGIEPSLHICARPGGSVAAPCGSAYEEHAGAGAVVPRDEVLARGEDPRHSLSICAAVTFASSLAGLTVADRLDPSQRLQRLLDRQQGGRLALRERAPCAERDRHRSHRHVARRLPQRVPVVLAERVPETVEFAADGLDVRLRGVSSVLGVLGQASPGLGGNPAAPTKLVEYASYTCGHCGAFETTEAPMLKSQYIANGKVSFEIRNLVRDEIDLTAAMLARCGGKGRFFGNHRHLMATQAVWGDDSKITPATVARLQANDLIGFMLAAHTELGLDKIMLARGITAAKAKACVTDAAALDQILAMTDEAVGPLGLTGTPSFLVNGNQVDGHDLASLKPHLAQ